MHNYVILAVRKDGIIKEVLYPTYARAEASWTDLMKHKDQLVSAVLLDINDNRVKEFKSGSE